MTVAKLINRLTQYFSWLYSRQWERWELLAIALIALVLLLLIIRRQRKGTIRKVRISPVRERSAIIGVKLTGHKQSHQPVKESQKNLLAHYAEKDGKQTKWGQPTKQFENLNEQIEQLQHEIAERRQAEEQLKQQADELTAANEQLQGEIAERQQAKEQLKQQVAELTAANEQFKSEIAERKQAEKQFKQQSAELTTANEQSKGEIAEREQAEKMPINSTEPAEETKEPQRGEPLDVQKLKAIAALAKQLQGPYQQQAGK